MVRSLKRVQSRGSVGRDVWSHAQSSHGQRFGLCRPLVVAARASSGACLHGSLQTQPRQPLRTEGSGAADRSSRTSAWGWTSEPAAPTASSSSAPGPARSPSPSRGSLKQLLGPDGQLHLLRRGELLYHGGECLAQSTQAAGQQRPLLPLPAPAASASRRPCRTRLLPYGSGLRAPRRRAD